ncbi:hypothetical protein [Candidatus Lokiarchaeum ossiferum]|uniref:hypothetical protein n=1 Tax=Candidatus Lokiarchaeum ossiferum TaxID=2951803 RepID=UPI00352FBB14
MFRENNSSYFEKRNAIPETSDKINYVGSRALFDPNFVPDVFVARENKTQLLKGTLLDAVEDNYATNVNMYGLKGTGKNLFVNQFFKSLINNQFNRRNRNIAWIEPSKKSPNFLIIKINCEKKELEQVFFAILEQLAREIQYSLKIDEIIRLSPGKLWNLIKILINKFSLPILLYLQQIEYIDSQIISKFFAFAKSTKNLQIITSINTGIQKYSFKQYEGLQHRIRMDDYNTSELKKITQDRSIMAFHNSLEVESINMIVDYVSDFDLQVPGSCINYLKEIHPYMQGRGQIFSDDLRGISQYHFDSFHLDSLSLADYIVDTGIEERLFLEYIVNYFQKKDQYYIPFSEIKNAYKMTSEELGFKSESDEFYSYLQGITNMQILRPSHDQKIQSPQRYKGIYPIAHYLTVPLEEINDVLSFSFGIMD